jgi:hypothetical protein
MLISMALNTTPTNVIPSVTNSGITISNIEYKAQSSNVVPILEEGIDFDEKELNNITRGKGGIVAMYTGVEGDRK